MPLRSLVLFHANCWDGFCAAWVWSKHWPDAEFKAVNYGEYAPEIEEGRDVAILDFSYYRTVLERMRAKANIFIVLDHHKTAQEELAGLDYCTFDMNKSGARLAWEYLNPKKPSPWLVDYTEDRDLWRHALPRSQEINAAIRSYPLTFGLWSEWTDKWERHIILDALAKEGAAILRFQRQVIDEHVDRAGLIALDGYDCLAVNATVLSLVSEIAGELATQASVGACWYQKQDGIKIWSLRSRDDEGVDVSAIAKARGGGGHVQAAGFEEEVTT